MLKNNNHSSKGLRLCKLFAAISPIVTTTITAFAFTLGAQQESRYLADAPLTYVLYTAVCLILAFSIYSAFLFPKKSVATALSPISALTIAGAICLSVTVTGGSLKQNGAEGKNTIELLIIILSLFVIVHSLSRIFTIGQWISILSGYMQIFLCIILVAKLYLDRSIEMNSPVKLFTQFALATVILGTLSDIRIIIGRSHAGIYFLSKILSINLSVIAAISAFIESITDQEKYTPIYFAAALFALSYAIPSLIELLRSSVAKPEINETTSPADNEITVEKIAEENSEPNEAVSSTSEEIAPEEIAEEKSESNEADKNDK